MQISGFDISIDWYFYVAIVGLIAGIFFLNQSRYPTKGSKFILTSLFGLCMSLVVLALCHAHLIHHQKNYLRPHLPVVLDRSASFRWLVKSEELERWWQDWVQLCKDRGATTAIYDMNSGTEIAANKNLSRRMAMALASIDSTDVQNASEIKTMIRTIGEFTSPIQGVVWLSDGIWDSPLKVSNIFQPQYPYIFPNRPEWDVSTKELEWKTLPNSKTWQLSLDVQITGKMPQSSSIQASFTCGNHHFVTDNFFANDSIKYAEESHKVQIFLIPSPKQMTELSTCDTVLVEVLPSTNDFFVQNNRRMYRLGKPPKHWNIFWVGRPTTPDAHFMMRALRSIEPEISIASPMDMQCRAGTLLWGENPLKINGKCNQVWASDKNFKKSAVGSEGSWHWNRQQFPHLDATSLQFLFEGTGLPSTLQLKGQQCLVSYQRGTETLCLLAQNERTTPIILDFYAEGYWEKGFNQINSISFNEAWQSFIESVVYYAQQDSSEPSIQTKPLGQEEIYTLGYRNDVLLDLATKSKGDVWTGEISKFPNIVSGEVEVIQKKESLFFRPSFLILLSLLLLCSYFSFRFIYSLDS